MRFIAAGQDAIAVPTDVAKSSDADALIDAAMSHFGRVDVLINNAAMVADNVLKPIWEITDDDWESAMSVNLSGAFYCARAAAKPMADAGKGKIVNVASGFGLRGGRDIYMYCSSKGGVIQLTRVLSFSLARYGITANSIVPGFIPDHRPRRRDQPYPAPVRRIPAHGQVGQARGSRPHRRVPGLRCVRLHDRRNVYPRRRGPRRRHLPHRPRSRRRAGTVVHHLDLKAATHTSLRGA